MSIFKGIKMSFKNKKDLIIKIVFLIFAAIMGFTIRYVSEKKDSKIEQIAEDFIKQETGIDIDFSINNDCKE